MRGEPVSSRFVLQRLTPYCLRSYTPEQRLLVVAQGALVRRIGRIVREASLRQQGGLSRAQETWENSSKLKSPIPIVRASEPNKVRRLSMSTLALARL